MAWFRNHYTCARCGKEWSDEWSAMCDDDCPRCGARHMSPHESIEILSPLCKARTKKIAALNDQLRRTLQGGEVIMTATVDALSEAIKRDALTELVSFDKFTEASDPYGEHDYGRFDLNGHTFLWKIDYYDSLCLRESEDPANADKTTRVLTLMLAEDY